MAFIFHEKTFDLLKTSAFVQTLRRQSVDEPYMNVLEDTYIQRQRGNYKGPQREQKKSYQERLV